MIRLLKQIRYKLAERIMAINKRRRRFDASLGEEDEASHFFVLGSGRNGSTLLARLLNGHSDLFLPPEQYALPYTIADYTLGCCTTWKSYVKKQLKRYQRNNQNWKLPLKEYEQLEKDLIQIAPQQRNPRAIYKQVFQRYARFDGQQSRVFGDHSPISTVFYKYLRYAFPGDKFIFLLRHPFDVVLSYSTMKDNPASDPVYASWKWNNSIRAYDYLKKNCCQVLLVKYEVLVSQPEECMQEILAFIGVEQQELIKETGKEAISDPLGTGTLAHHQNLYKPISAKSVNRWKKGLSEEVIERIKGRVQQNAQRFGYDLEQ